MTVTREDIQSFGEFASQRLDHGGAESLAELVSEWEAHREHEETAADIRQGIADLEAGRGKPVTEAFADVRKKLGLAE